MKKLVAILLVFVFMGSTFHFDEILKIPFLINHFEQNKERDKNISAISFLYDHYLADSKLISGEERKKDMQLPFKSDQTLHQFVFLFIENNSFINAKFYKRFTLNCPSLNDKVLTRSIEIWQPPKID